MAKKTKKAAKVKTEAAPKETPAKKEAEVKVEPKVVVETPVIELKPAGEVPTENIEIQEAVIEETATDEAKSPEPAGDIPDSSELQPPVEEIPEDTDEDTDILKEGLWILDTAVVPDIAQTEFSLGLNVRLQQGQRFKIKGTDGPELRAMWVGGDYVIGGFKKKKASQTWVVLVGDQTPILGREVFKNGSELEIVE